MANCAGDVKSLRTYKAICLVRVGHEDASLLQRSSSAAPTFLPKTTRPQVLPAVIFDPQGEYLDAEGRGLQGFTLSDQGHHDPGHLAHHFHYQAKPPWFKFHVALCLFMMISCGEIPATTRQAVTVISLRCFDRRARRGVALNKGGSTDQGCHFSSAGKQ